LKKIEVQQNLQNAMKKLKKAKMALEKFKKAEDYGQ